MSLTELLLALCIMSILFMLAAPAATEGMDSVRVRAAREAAFGLAARARSVALARGGADIVFDLESETASIVASDGVIVSGVSFSEYGVDVASGAADRVVLSYDARGLGRMASRTVHFLRGNGQAGLTFSSYGRVRRW